MKKHVGEFLVAKKIRLFRSFPGPFGVCVKFDERCGMMGVKRSRWVKVVGQTPEELKVADGLFEGMNGEGSNLWRSVKHFEAHVAMELMNFAELLRMVKLISNEASVSERCGYEVKELRRVEKCFQFEKSEFEMEKFGVFENLAESEKASAEKKGRRLNVIVIEFEASVIKVEAFLEFEEVG